jgi:hypothetical protein
VRVALEQVQLLQVSLDKRKESAQADDDGHDLVKEDRSMTNIVSRSNEMLNKY